MQVSEVCGKNSHVYEREREKETPIVHPLPRQVAHVSVGNYERVCACVYTCACVRHVVDTSITVNYEIRP